GRVLETRLKSYFGPESAPQTEPLSIPPPTLVEPRSAYARFVVEHDLTPGQRLVVLLALIPHVRPQLLDVLWSRNDVTQRGFTEFGGMQGLTHGGFIPTGETA